MLRTITFYYRHVKSLYWLHTFSTLSLLRTNNPSGFLLGSLPCFGELACDEVLLAANFTSGENAILRAKIFLCGFGWLKMALDKRARILYNSKKMISTILPLTEARNRFAELIEAVSSMFAHFTITRRGKPEAVLMSKEDYDGLMETLEILSDKEAVKSIRQGLKDIKAGRIESWEEVKKELNL